MLFFWPVTPAVLRSKWFNLSSKLSLASVTAEELKDFYFLNRELAKINKRKKEIKKLAQAHWPYHQRMSTEKCAWRCSPCNAAGLQGFQVWILADPSLKGAINKIISPIDVAVVPYMYTTTNRHGYVLSGFWCSEHRTNQDTMGGDQLLSKKQEKNTHTHTHTQGVRCHFLTLL